MQLSSHQCRLDEKFLQWICCSGCIVTERCMKRGVKTWALLSNYQITPRFSIVALGQLPPETQKYWPGIQDFFFCSKRPVIYFETHEREWTKCSADIWKPTGWYSSREVGWMLLGAVWPFWCTGERWGGVGLCLSALHPKVLCELLDLQQIFSVDCGTGSGQRAQHVRLQRKQRYQSVMFLKYS